MSKTQKINSIYLLFLIIYFFFTFSLCLQFNNDLIKKSKKIQKQKYQTLAMTEDLEDQEKNHEMGKSQHEIFLKDNNLITTIPLKRTSIDTNLQLIQSKELIPKNQTSSKLPVQNKDSQNSLKQQAEEMQKKLLQQQKVFQEMQMKTQKKIKLLKQDSLELKKLFNDTKAIYHKNLKIDQDLQKQLDTYFKDMNNTKSKIIEDKQNQNNKLDIINKKLDQSMNLKLTSEIINSQNKINKLQTQISKLKIDIRNIKNKLPDDSKCNIYSNCGSCTADSNCGWCSVTKTCVGGNANGPSRGQCSFFNYGSCGSPRKCGDYNKCGVIKLKFF